MSDRAPAPLHYFAFFPSDWLGSPSVRRMKREERGDFVDLLCIAWGDGTVEPSLEPGDMEGVSERVKMKFVQKNGRFYNEKLSAVWREGQLRHAQAVKRGKASGKARRERKRLETNSKASRNGDEQSRLVMALESNTDSLGRGAGAAASDEPPPAQTPGEKTDRLEARSGGGLTHVSRFLANLLPRPA